MYVECGKNDLPFKPTMFISGDWCGYCSTPKKEGVQTCHFPLFLCKQDKFNTETGSTSISYGTEAIQDFFSKNTKENLVRSG
jgi:hypothetical protein